MERSPSGHTLAKVDQRSDASFPGKHIYQQRRNLVNPVPFEAKHGPPRIAHRL